jgi:hypothetical protein
MERVTIEVFMEKTADGGEKAVIECRPNVKDIPHGPVRELVNGILSVALTLPGWKQTVDKRRPLKLADDCPSPTPPPRTDKEE